ncbi:MAG: tetratricopeptide repeat protein [Candidatus Lokiarchaeota archaeon]|nr:tetratricopeptide repeat protein [Candidatus Lokiarchaeota archaeon]
MKLTDIKINDLFNSDRRFTFLVGAGCSVSAPSCLPAGHAMMEALINYTCKESEIKDIIELMKSGTLRFEALVEIIRNEIDKELTLIDYYSQCDKPNMQHFFLAEMIKQGNFVMTTNFDFLIEYALNHSGVPFKEIVPVITKEDFEIFSDPYELLKKKKKSVYKIHGSTENIITKKSTRDSLVATIQAFGSNKEGENVFQLEAFKRPLFENITKERSLVVMGYSGSDDFDIVPTLKILKNLQDVIWINYSHNIDIGNEQIYEINDNTFQSLNKMDINLRKVIQILFEIWQMKNVNNVFLVNVNTNNMVQKLLETQPALSSDNFSLEIKEYFKKIYQEVSEIEKYYIPYKIYYEFDLDNKAMNCLKNILQIAEKLNDKTWKTLALNYIGSIFRRDEKYSEALKKMEEALELAKDLGSLNLKSLVFDNMAMTYNKKGDYPAAINLYKDASRIDKQLGNLKNTAVNLNNIAYLYESQEEYTKALENYEEALKIAEKLGDLNLKCTVLCNSGKIYIDQGNYSEARKRIEEAEMIADKLGRLDTYSSCLIYLGGINKDQGRIQEALKLYEKALEIAKKLGDPEFVDTMHTLIKMTKGKGEGAEEDYEMGIDSSQEIIKTKQEFICNSKWNIKDIMNFLKGFLNGFFNSFRDSMNWQRVKTISKELKPNMLDVSSGDNFKAVFHIIEGNKKTRTIQMEWEIRSSTSNHIWESLVKALTDIFKKPGIKSVKKR